MSDSGTFDRFTERARRVLDLAQEEAQRFNHNYIGTEHLLMGLTRDKRGLGGQILSAMGVDPARVRSSVEFIIGRGERHVSGEIGLTPRAKKVIELAIDESRRLKHHHIGTEHLLLGIIREGEGIAAGVLESLGVNLERVRKRTIEAVQDRQRDPKVTAEDWSEDEMRAEGSATTPSPGSVSMPAGGSDEAVRGSRTWEHLLLTVAWDDDAPVVIRIQGADEWSAEPRRLAEALSELGDEGWELAGVDPWRPNRSLYVLKRRRGPQRQVTEGAG